MRLISDKNWRILQNLEDYKKDLEAKHKGMRDEVAEIHSRSMDNFIQSASMVNDQLKDDIAKQRELITKLYCDIDKLQKIKKRGITK